MRTCIVGAGAIGGFLGARLARAGHEVTIVARGESLAALRAEGIRIFEPDGREIRAGVAATDDCAGAGTFDVVALATKAHQLPAIAPGLAPLLAEDTVVLPMQNGVPFWYFQGIAGANAGRVVRSVDPEGALLRGIEPRRIVGCVVYCAAERIAPGRIAHVSGSRFLLAEIDDRRSARVGALREAFADAGLQAPEVEDIRGEVWLKLWGNAVFNPISALTRATLGAICADPDGRALATRLMREAGAVAAKLGVAIPSTLERRIEDAARVGHHKTSMLQDVEAGRALEIDALCGAVVELAELAGVETPALRAIYEAVKLLERSLTSRTAADRPGRSADSPSRR